MKYLISPKLHHWKFSSVFQQQKRALHSVCRGFFIWKWNAKNNDLNRKVSIIWKLKCSDFIFFMTTVWNIMRLLSPEMQDKRPINSQYVKVQQWFFNSCMQKKMLKHKKYPNTVFWTFRSHFRRINYWLLWNGTKKAMYHLHYLYQEKRLHPCIFTRSPRWICLTTKSF